MSYQDSLVAAGARVVAFSHFGDWQGSWVALVEYQGQRGWVQGSFGSCKGFEFRRDCKHIGLVGKK